MQIFLNLGKQNKIMKNIQSDNEQKRIFSWIQPTGNLHLDNYLGAIKNSNLDCWGSSYTIPNG